MNPRLEALIIRGERLGLLPRVDVLQGSPRFTCEALDRLATQAHGAWMVLFRYSREGRRVRSALTANRVLDDLQAFGDECRDCEAVGRVLEAFCRRLLRGAYPRAADDQIGLAS